MNAHTSTCVWQHPDRPNPRYDRVRVREALSWARKVQGLVEAKLALLGFEQPLDMAAEARSQEANPAGRPNVGCPAVLRHDAA